MSQLSSYTDPHSTTSNGAARGANGVAPLDVDSAAPVSLQLDLQRARTTLIEAELSGQPSERYLTAHLGALRVAAIVLALRARPRRGSSRPRNAWLVLAEVAPELGEWAAYFAATEGKREAVRAGATAIVTAREADDLLRDAQSFLSLVEGALDRSRPGAACSRSTSSDRSSDTGRS